MKNRFFAFLMIGFSLAVQAQKNPFAHKTFRIDNYTHGKFEISEDLKFTKTDVEGSICVQYVFEKASYTTHKNQKGFWEFSCVMFSEKEGKMMWNGITKDNTISGSYRWSKEGQDPIDYTLKEI